MKRTKIILLSVISIIIIFFVILAFIPIIKENSTQLIYKQNKRDIDDSEYNFVQYISTRYGLSDALYENKVLYECIRYAIDSKGDMYSYQIQNQKNGDVHMSYITSKSKDRYKLVCNLLVPSIGKIKEAAYSDNGFANYIYTESGDLYTSNGSAEIDFSKPYHNVKQITFYSKNYLYNDNQIFLTGEGQLLGFGENKYNQKIDGYPFGTITSQNIGPTLIMDGVKTFIVSDPYHCAALKQNGELWVWFSYDQDSYINHPTIILSNVQSIYTNESGHLYATLGIEEDYLIRGFTSDEIINFINKQKQLNPKIKNKEKL